MLSYHWPVVRPWKFEHWQNWSLFAINLVVKTWYVNSWRSFFSARERHKYILYRSNIAKIWGDFFQIFLGLTLSIWTMPSPGYPLYAHCGVSFRIMWILYWIITVLILGHTGSHNNMTFKSMLSFLDGMNGGLVACLHWSSQMITSIILQMPTSVFLEAKVRALLFPEPARCWGIHKTMESICHLWFRHQQPCQQVCFNALYPGKLLSYRVTYSYSGILEVGVSIKCTHALHPVRLHSDMSLAL